MDDHVRDNCLCHIDAILGTHLLGTHLAVPQKPRYNPLNQDPVKFNYNPAMTLLVELAFNCSLPVNIYNFPLCVIRYDPIPT